MELSAKIVDCIQPLAIFVKHFIKCSQGYEYASDKAKENPVVLSLIPQKIRAATYANIFHF